MNIENGDRQYITELFARAREAQEIAENFSQRRVDELAAAIVYTLSRERTAREIAQMAFEETGMGLVESKYAKMAKKMPGVFYNVKDQKTVGVIEHNPETGITRIAKSVGVIGALVPVTNCEATPFFKGILALRGRNAVVFAPHPKGKRTTIKVVEIMRSV